MISIETTSSASDSPITSPEWHIDKHDFLDRVDSSSRRQPTSFNVDKVDEYFKSLIDLANTHAPDDKAPDNEQDIFALRLCLIKALSDDMDVRTALYEAGYKLDDAITAERLTSDLAGWLNGLRPRNETQPARSNAGARVIGHRGVIAAGQAHSVEAEFIESDGIALDVATTTVQDLREKYDILLDIVDASKLHNLDNSLYQDDEARLLAIIAVGREAAAGDEGLPNKQLVKRGQVAQDILVRMHFSTVTKFVHKYPLKVPYDDILYGKGVGFLHKAVSEPFDSDRGSVGGFIWTCMRNALKDIVKSSDYRRRYDIDTDTNEDGEYLNHSLENMPSSDDVEGGIIRQADARYVHTLLSRLDDDDREVVSMNYGIDGHDATPSSGIAVKLGITDGTVKGRLYRSRVSMRRMASVGDIYEKAEKSA